MGRFISGSVFGLVLGLSISVASAQTRAIDDAVGRGISAYFQGQPAVVEQYMTVAINAGSRDPQSLYFRGLALWQMGRQDEARADFAQGARLEAVSPGMYRTSGRSLERVQGAVRLELQRARQAARVMTTAQREKDRLARFDLQTGKSLAPENVPAPTATAATLMPMAPTVDPNAPKVGTTLPSADLFSTPKPAMTPMPAATPAPTATPPATPAPATTPVAVTAPLMLPAEPELLYAEIVKQTANGRADIFWEMLPAKHQSDIKCLVQTLGAKMDKELWEKSFTVLGKIANVLKTKREFITGHPAVAGALMNFKINEQPATPEQIQQGLDVTATFLQTIFTSELSTVDGLAKLDPQAFFAGTVSKSMKVANDAMVQLSGKTKEQLIDETLAKSKITANKMGEDVVELTFETQGVEPTATVSKTMLWKRVDGKWLPAEMVDGWDEKVAQAKAAIETTDFAGPPKAAATAVTTIVEPILDQLLAAPDQDAFNGVIAGVLPLVQGLLGGLTPEAGS